MTCVNGLVCTKRWTRESVPSLTDSDVTDVSRSKVCNFEVEESLGGVVRSLLYTEKCSEIHCPIVAGRPQLVSSSEDSKGFTGVGAPEMECMLCKVPRVQSAKHYPRFARLISPQHIVPRTIFLGSTDGTPVASRSPSLLASLVSSQPNKRTFTRTDLLAHKTNHHPVGKAAAQDNGLSE